MWTIGFAETPPLPHFASKLDKRGNAAFASIPSGTTANK